MAQILTQTVILRFPADAAELMRRSALRGLLLLAVLLAGAGCNRPSPPAAGRPNPPFPAEVAESWQYPGAKLLSSGGGGSAGSGTTSEGKSFAVAPSLRIVSTSDPIEKVWSYYAGLTGIKDDFKPGSTSSQSNFSVKLDKDGAAGSLGSVLYSTGDLDHPSVRSATIVAQFSRCTASVGLIQLQGENRTDISLAIVPNP